MENQASKMQMIDHAVALSTVQAGVFIQEIAAHDSDLYTLEDSGKINQISFCPTRSQYLIEPKADLKAYLGPDSSDEIFLTMALRHPYIIAYSNNAKLKTNTCYLIGLYSGKLLNTYTYQCIKSRGQRHNNHRFDCKANNDTSADHSRYP